MGAAFAVAPSAQAAVGTFTVGTSADTAGASDCATATNTDCSLRDAISAADDGDTTDQDHIVFKSSLTGSTITLGSNLPYVDESLYVEGLGAGSLTVNGNSHRIFFVNPPGPAEFKLAKITLSGAAGLDGPAINVIDGDANGSTGGPSLVVESAILTGNSSSGRGGGISAAAGSVLVQDSTISDNLAGAPYEGGGGIYARLFTGSMLTIQNSTISGNQTIQHDADGGGVRAFLTPVTIQNSTISGNSVQGVPGPPYYAGHPAQGGGVHASGFEGVTATIQDSTIADNSSTGPGGGIAAHSTDLAVDDSTVSGNQTSGDFGFGGGVTVFSGQGTTIQRSTISGNGTDGVHASGGGVHSAGPSSGVFAIRNSTIAENEAPGLSARGGGIRSDGDETFAPTLTNTIVSGNAAGDTGSDISRPGAFRASFSLIGNPNGASITAVVAGSNILGVDPVLEPLALNDSLNGTETHALALAPTSPAIDCGSSGGTTTDQRGLTRPVDLGGRTNSTATGADGADIGAYEVQAPASASGACPNNKPPPPPTPPGPTPTPAPSPTPTASGSTFDLNAAVKKCKKKYKRAVRKKRAHDALTSQVQRKLKKKRAKCIKRAKRTAAAADQR